MGCQPVLSKATVSPTLERSKTNSHIGTENETKTKTSSTDQETQKKRFSFKENIEIQTMKEEEGAAAAAATATAREAAERVELARVEVGGRRGRWWIGCLCLI